MEMNGDGKAKKQKQKQKQKNGLGLHIEKLPLHILCEILLKLPAWSMIGCRCVCKTWRNLVNDSRFQQLYLSRAPTSFVLLSAHHRLLCIDCSSSPQQKLTPSSSSCLAMAMLPSSSPCPSGTDPIPNHNDNDLQLQFQLQFQDNYRTTTTTTTTRSFIAFQAQAPTNLVNSSNGLLCLRGMAFDYYVCNPLLGEILSLPPPPTATATAVLFSAFGFDPHPQSKQYKILQLVLKSNNKMVAELYQLGDETWRVIDDDDDENAPRPRPRPNTAFDPSLNGALHWLADTTTTHNISEFICSFDLHTNHFKSLPPPSHFDLDYLNNQVSAITVGVLQGRLCLCYVNGNAQFHTWFMQDYGVKESWTKRFTIDINSYCGLRLHDKHTPIGFTTYGDMWLKADSDSDSLVSYTPETGTFKVIDIGSVTSNIQAIPHVFTFVSLKDIVNLCRYTHLQFNILRLNKN